jgi:hypothetical protein
MRQAGGSESALSLLLLFISCSVSEREKRQMMKSSLFFHFQGAAIAEAGEELILLLFGCS